MNAHEIAQRLAQSAASVAQYLLPQGKKAGREWKVGSAQGEPGNSLSVSIGGAKAGIWSDFSTGQAGDLLDLWAITRGLSLLEAMKEAGQYLGLRVDMPAKQPKKEYVRPQKPQCKKPEHGARNWLIERGLSEATIKAFRIGEKVESGKTYAIFPYIRGGELINAKTRNIAEKKDMRQESGAEPCLFGWHLIEPRARSVCITEGEIDAMTLHQYGIPALSVNAGAGNHQWIESDWERLEQFSDIVLCYDDDDAGRKGVQEVAQRLGIERCRLATFGTAKDANEFLTEHHPAMGAFAQCVAQAKYLDPEELRQLAEYTEDVIDMFYPPESARTFAPLSFCGSTFDWWEWQPGQVSVWTGINGHGKTSMLMQALIAVMKHGERVCVFSGEVPAARQQKFLTKQLSGLDVPSKPYIRYIGNWLRERIWIFNNLETASIDRLLAVFKYGFKRYGISHFVIDSLMTTDVPEDGAGWMTAQKTAMTKIAIFARQTGAHVHIVAHPRKAMDEKRPPGKLDVAGSGHITNAADNVFAVWSAGKEEGQDLDTHDATLELLKDRNGEAGRRKLYFYYNSKARQYSTDKRRLGYTYVPFSTEDMNHEVS